MKFEQFLKERRPVISPVKRWERRNARCSVMSQYVQLRGWEIENRIHARSREVTDSSRDISKEELFQFYNRMIDHVDTLTGKVNREFLVRSKSLDRSMVINLDTYGDPNDRRNPNKVKQIRVITVLPVGRHRPKPGTKVILIENKQYEVIEIE